MGAVVIELYDEKGNRKNERRDRMCQQFHLFTSSVFYRSYSNGVFRRFQEHKYLGKDNNMDKGFILRRRCFWMKAVMVKSLDNN